MSEKGTATPAQTGDVSSTPTATKPTGKINEDGLTAIIIIGGEEMHIKKLKAGKFYNAQKAFAEVYSSILNIYETPKSMPQNINVNDPKQLQEIANSISPTGLTKMMSEAPSKMAEFVAICAEKPRNEILDKAYPEEISEAFAICYKLNNVIENLKKLGAPMQALGAGLGGE